MKRILILLAFSIIAGCAMSQNVIGKTIYYNDSTQYRPWHGYGYDNTHYDFDDIFNTVFLEPSIMFSRDDLAFGFNLAVVPGQWGGYVKGAYSHYADWWSFGPAYRLSNRHQDYDLQLYGGLMIGHTPYPNNVGGEIGLRISGDRTFCNSWYSLWSGSIGFSVINQDIFLTIGMSLPISFLCTPIVFLF